MTKNLGRALLTAAGLGLSLSAQAREPGLEPLQLAFGAGRQAVVAHRVAAESAGFTALVRPESWQEFPPPDAETLAWLSSRLPGLDAPKVRVVPAAAAEEAMQRAASAGATYLDVLSAPAFAGDAVYFAPASVLNPIHAAFISGAMPISGTAGDGRPFQMVALVAGQGKVDILYDLSGFTYQDKGNTFKVASGGRISVRILGPGDIAMEGLSASGVPLVCPWAKIQRMTKESAYKVRVETNCGARGGNDIHPVRRR